MSRGVARIDKLSKGGSGCFLSREKKQEGKLGKQPGSTDESRRGLRISSGSREVADLERVLNNLNESVKESEKSKMILDLGYSNCH